MKGHNCRNSTRPHVVVPNNQSQGGKSNLILNPRQKPWFSQRIYTYWNHRMWGVFFVARGMGLTHTIPISVYPIISHYILVGGLDQVFFHSVGNVIIPTFFHIFQRGRSTTNKLFWLAKSPFLVISGVISYRGITNPIY